MTASMMNTHVRDNLGFLYDVFGGVQDYGANWLIQAGRELRFSDPDVAHGMTGAFPTDVYGRLNIVSGTAGGFQIVGASDDDSAGMLVAGVIGTASPTATTPALRLRGFKKNGTTVQALANTETVCTIENNAVAKVSVFGDGGIDIIEGGLNVGFSGTPVADRVAIGDSDFYMENLGTAPRIQFESNGSLVYTRSTDQLRISVGGNTFDFAPNLFDIGPATIEFTEMTAPAAPAANDARLYVQDNGAGKTQLMCLFSSGAAQQVAIQP